MPPFQDHTVLYIGQKINIHVRNGMSIKERCPAVLALRVIFSTKRSRSLANHGDQEAAAKSVTGEGRRGVTETNRETQ